MWQQWVNVILGAWIIAVPFIGLSAAASLWTLVITGIVIAALGLWGVQETHSERETGQMRMQH